MVPHAVAVLHGPGEDVSDGLDSRSGATGIRPDNPLKRRCEIVQQEERVELRVLTEAECAAQVHARAFDGWSCFTQPLIVEGHIDLILLKLHSPCTRRSSAATARS